MPYSEEDAAYFFGRDRLRETVIDNLRAYRLSILYGPSGVGKSSVLNAGVVSRIRDDGRRRLANGEPPEDVALVFSSWAVEPVAGLGQAIRDALEELSPELARALPSGSLADMVAAAADRIEGSLLIILDQFEEYFLYHPSEDSEDSFADELARMIARGAAPANFLVSIREDGLAKLDRFEGRIPNLLDNLLRIDHLDRASAQEAIGRPIEQWNQTEAPEAERVRIEPELVEAVLDGVEWGRLRVGETKAELGIEPRDAVRDRRTQTPYLQLVLTRLWAEEISRGSRVLRLTTLEQLGGAARIVATHLDEAMASFPRREQAVAASIFRYLVTPSGTKISHRSEDLAEYAELPEAAVTPVLERLTREARIVQPVGHSRYEIYHDALAGPILEWRRRWEEERRRRNERRRLFATVLVAAAIVTLLALGNTFDPLERQTVDTRFSIRGAETPRPDLVVVGIDEKTFEDLAEPWPFTHDEHAAVVDRLKRDGAKVIGIDIQFSEPGGNSDEQLIALVDAVDRAGNVVLSTTEVDDLRNGNAFNYIVPERVLQSRTPGAINNYLRRDLGVEVAHGALPGDPGGVIRRMPYSTDGVKSFSIALAGEASGRPVDPDSLGGRSAWIDYSGPPGSIRTIPYSDVRFGKFKRGTFRDKIVVVGTSAPVFQDLHRTPTSGEGEVSGPEVQAHAVGTAMSGFPLSDSPRGLDIALIVLLGLVAPVASLRTSVLRTLALVLVIGCAYAVIVQLAFNGGIVLSLVYPLAALLISTFTVLFATVRT